MIKQIMALLDPEQRKQLMCAFEAGTHQYIELPDDKFIGVNVPSLDYLEVTDERGDFAYGNIKKDKEE
jgi:hypothetical protein